MSDFEDLKFDDMEVDRTLAEEYFAKKKKAFSSLVKGIPIKHTDDLMYILDQCANRIYYISPGDIENPKDYKLEISHLAPHCLAKNIRDNEELFCQLMHAVQNYSIDDVKKDIQLLINKCLHISNFFVTYQANLLKECRHLGITIARAPLYYLSRAVSALCAGSYVNLIAAPQTAAVCTLFMELCYEAGFRNISLYLMRAEDIKPDPYVPAEGCIGIVTETADKDSAVHAFLSSTTVYPWKLNTVLVQESVYEEFQRALQWKCNVNVSDEMKEHEPHLKLYSADTHVANRKIFLIDYVGPKSINSELQAVEVNAYRTNKELLGIMSKYDEPFVSLWCTDSSSANEIALSIKASCVWINSYAMFNGSPRVSDAVPVEKLTPRLDLKEWTEPILYEEFLNRQTAWLQLDLNKRREVMLEALANYIASYKDDSRKVAIVVQTKLADPTLDFIEVNKNNMWIGIQFPTENVVLNEFYDSRYFSSAIASIVHGNRVMLRSIAFRDYDAFIKDLQKAGVPILLNTRAPFPSLKYEVYNTRAIYSSFGTIFAN